MKWLLFAWRNVLRNKRRTTIAAGTIAMGAVALLAAAGYVNATFIGLRESTINGGVGHFQVGAPGQFNGYQETPMELALSAKQADAVSKKIEQTEGVRFSMKRVLFEGLISNGDRTIIFLGRGVEPRKEKKLSRTFAPIIQGRSLPKIRKNKKVDLNKVILGKDLAKNLGVKPGDFVTLLSTTVHGSLNAIDLTVNGIYTTGNPEMDKRYLMVPLPVAQSLLATDKVSRVVGILNNTKMTDSILSDMQTAFPKLDMKDWLELTPFYQKVVTIYQSVFIVMGAIVVLLVLFSTTNTMLMSIMERAREIGTIRAFGISRGRLMFNFLMEGGIIGMIGATVGAIAAYVFAQSVNTFGIMMPPPPGRNVKIPLLFAIDVPYFAAVMSLLILVGAISAWYPSKTAARQKIVEALDHV
ncbi:MAG TPA: FtsX-like permease family protein [Rhodospirillales bacterium]|nr:FtsX-like permease family protein [Rhodospirillales bacterium]